MISTTYPNSLSCNVIYSPVWKGCTYPALQQHAGAFEPIKEFTEYVETQKKFSAAVLILGCEDKFLGVCELEWENYCNCIFTNI